MSLDKWWNDVNCVYFNKLYFIHMICISMLFRFSLLVRNVIIHSPCDICVLDPLMILNFVFVETDD